MVPPTHLAGANTEKETGHGKSPDTNKNNSHYNATSCQPASGKTPANAQVARHCRSLGRRPRQPARHATAAPRGAVHGAGRPAPGFGVGACTGTARPNRFFPLGALERPIFLTLASSTELACLLTPDISPLRPLPPARRGAWP